MTDKPNLARLLDGVPRYSASALMMTLDGCKAQPSPEGPYVRYADVLAALSAALPADVAGVVEEAGKVLEGVTPGRVVQFHPSFCKEAEGAPFSEWDTSHDLSVIQPDGKRYRIGSMRHANDAAFFQWCREGVPVLIAIATAQAAQIAEFNRMTEAPNLHVEWLKNRAEAAETALAAERAKTARLVEALKPFVDYMADGGDKNYEGDLLPDTEGMGWVYLTVGDFRRARAAITEAGQ